MHESFWLIGGNGLHRSQRSIGRANDMIRVCTRVCAFACLNNGERLREMKRLLPELRALASADAISPTPPSQAHSTEGIPLINVELSESNMRLLATLLTFSSLIASFELPTIQEENRGRACVDGSPAVAISSNYRIYRKYFVEFAKRWNRVPHDYYPCGSYYEAYDPDPMLDHVQVDWSRMMGRWLEGLVYPSRHDPEKCVAVFFSFDITTTYRNNTNHARVEYAYAFNPTPNLVKVKLEAWYALFGYAHWLYKVGPIHEDSFGRSQYEYVIFSGCGKFPAKVLARNPEQFGVKYKKEVMDWLEKHGFCGVSNLVLRDSSSCNYTESVVEKFGE
ncbi:hypothetical protein PRIPAC_84306 [Pristionchus pacificus]|uniref:Lipocalin domain-containing protein n=1 Tax=Pristionchus pacificus TaxID=54126 RepID=A0A2A6BGY6_PRIPA|nr:hypothetical protein PRIPAC_84306 [Pristionchus pacificus]|eukprot:PDM65154.1 hypothetical protein PRIPAC_53403 [Pristionchus pacificus]